ncbi:MAG: hypothetical protein ACOCV3_02185 [Halanaerobiales bacterium]
MTVGFLNSFKSKLILFIAVIMLVPLGIYGYITITGSLDQTRNSVYDNNIALAENFNEQLTNSMNQTENIMQMMAKMDKTRVIASGTVGDVSDHILTKMEKELALVSNIEVINMEGEEVFSTSGDKTNVAEREYFKKQGRERAFTLTEYKVKKRINRW